MSVQRQYSIVARSYADALFRAARNQRILQRVQEECKVLAAVFERNQGKLKVFLTNPRISIQNKLGLLEKALGPRFSPVTLRLLRVLVERGRLGRIDEILSLFQEMVEQAEGIFEARLESAVELGFQEKLRLKTALEAWTGRRLKIDYAVNPGLLGGLVFRFRDTLIDSSLRAGLAKIRRRMMTASLGQG